MWGLLIIPAAVAALVIFARLERRAHRRAFAEADREAREYMKSKGRMPGRAGHTGINENGPRLTDPR